MSPAGVVTRWTAQALFHTGNCRGQRCPGKGSGGWRVGFSTDTGSRNEPAARLVPALYQFSNRRKWKPVTEAMTCHRFAHRLWDQTRLSST